MTHDELMMQTGEAMAAWHKDKSTKIEWCPKDEDEHWCLASSNPMWLYSSYYRIAKMPVEKWVPWTEDNGVVGLALQHSEDRNRFALIINQEADKVGLGNGDWMSLGELFYSNWRQVGGDRCGKKVVE